MDRSTSLTVEIISQCVYTHVCIKTKLHILSILQFLNVNYTLNKPEKIRSKKKITSQISKYHFRTALFEILTEI